jgi:hypothetical protein
MKKPSPEVKRHVEALLDKLGATPARLRSRRALLILEQIGSATAQETLEQLATGEPRHSLTTDARESLARLRKRQG